MENLIKIIERANKDRHLVTQEEDELVTSNLIVLDKEKFHREKEKLHGKAEETEQKQKERKRKQEQGKTVPKKKSKIQGSEQSAMPVITCPSDLVGKRVCHLFIDGKGGEQ